MFKGVTLQISIGPNFFMCLSVQETRKHNGLKVATHIKSPGMVRYLEKYALDQNFKNRYVEYILPNGTKHATVLSPPNVEETLKFEIGENPYFFIADPKSPKNLA